MPAEITMPQLSDTMTEGTVVKWLKSEGDAVHEGDIVAEVETDKATMEMEGPDASGVLAVVLAKEGDKVGVGQPIGVLAVKGEDPQQVKATYAQGAKAAGGPAAKSAADADGAGKPQPTGGSTATLTGDEGGTPQPPDASTQSGAGTSDPPGRSPDRGQTRTTVAGDYGGPQQVRVPMPAASDDTHGYPTDNGHSAADGTSRGERLRVSPLARRIAESKNVDLSKLTGSGPGGRIVQKDVLDFLARPAPAKPADRPADTSKDPSKEAKPAAAMPQRVASGQTETAELTKMRATIAQRLQQSKQQIPHFYETIDVDMSAANTLRERLNKSLEGEKVRLSIGDLIAKSLATALRRHPALNATFDGKTITRHGDVHLGMAVALPEGLIVPVLRSIDQMGLKEIRQRSADLVDRARSQRLKRDQMSGATFTVSNLGTYGIREFSAIVNPPEVGILAIGSAEERAVVRNAQIVARPIMTVTLSADHRVVDGATAAEFLRTLRGLLEEPGLMLA